ncbi:hypothetical protein ACH4VR_19525 [Streptomyces sp. NPDC020883]|uniref:hypothetical protein n=1 Tax=Streptomyces sp. NPDC020883 TaxID=3365099 RepID=UPI00379F7D92
MSAKNLKSTEPYAPTVEGKAVHPAFGASLETITLSHHLNIGGKSYLPGAKIRVAADYARRLRLSGYVARS